MHDVQTTFLPEALYHIDENMNWRKIALSYINDTAITCKVTKLDYYNDILEVDLGNNFKGTISLEEARIYPCYKNDLVSSSIYTLVGHTIRAKIVSIKPTIELSRKQNMLQALPYISQCSHFDKTTITGFSKFSAFVDVGAGITGKISRANFAPVIFDDITDIGFKLYDTFPTDVLEFDPVNNRFELSRTSCLPHFTTVLSKNTVVTCKIFGSVSDLSGSYVCIDKNFAGIVDSVDGIEFRYGDEIVAVIAKDPDVSKKGVQLNFISFV